MKRKILALGAVLAWVCGVFGATHEGVQLWENGPLWAKTNIGANSPTEAGYYFWWGDIVGYARENDKWVASDGSSSSYSFPSTSPTYNKSNATLQSQGWITADGVLSPKHDAAHVHWGGNWRMPTKQEMSDLIDKCNWTWTTRNGVEGYLVKGKGSYASVSIFLPCAGLGSGSSLLNAGARSNYWSSAPNSVSSYAWTLWFNWNGHDTDGYRYRWDWLPIRPVQNYIE